MIKYATYTIYECSHCKHTVEIPLHLKETPQLEKYASYCTHDWQELGEKQNATTDAEKSRSLQSSEART